MCPKYVGQNIVLHCMGVSMSFFPTITHKHTQKNLIRMHKLIKCLQREHDCHQNLFPRYEIDTNFLLAEWFTIRSSWTPTQRSSDGREVKQTRLLMNQNSTDFRNWAVNNSTLSTSFRDEWAMEEKCVRAWVNHRRNTLQ